MILALLLSTLPTLHCGVERADVKHLTDPYAPRVAAAFAHPQQVNVAYLAKLPVPQPPVLGWEPRGLAAPVEAQEEFQVFQVDAVIALAKHEADQDLHLPIRDPEFPQFQIVSEAVHPGCLPTPDPSQPDSLLSQVVAKITAVRAAIRAAVGGSITTASLKKLVGLHVRVTGVGFYDKCHGQVGGAPNCFELHPIIGFEVLQ